MSRMTFINLPVKDLVRTKEFFTSLGFTFNEEFGDESTACLVISDLAFAMLHEEPKFAGFTQQQVVDTSTAREVLIGLSAQSREDVDTLTEHAVAAGGRALGDADDQGYMYMRAFLDPDGHQWSAIYLDMSGVPGS